MTPKTKIDKKRMLQLYNEGKSPDEIATYFGTKSGLNIEKLIRKEIGEVNRDKILALWLAGWGVERIMKECNITEQEVREVVFHE